ncbi:hypothetical protein ACFSC6_07830 [Rufibacter sediminis]|uniref:Uncharacterized protein n=1 Tax=Rufibacter sediminis TaxID=2762756 RepID=A0ABR6VPX5_9BACT|nr:hypothetical protein [Rufibacter sediminis]MBC3539251.1 hypothetical protein [Rufibacter sediminis]
MELEEMQNAWNSLSHRVERQDALSNKLLANVTQQNYQSKFNKVRYSEFAGTMVCYAGAAYLSVHLTQIEDVFAQVLAALAIGLLLLLPVISLASVRALKSVNISSASYLETIHTFGRQKIRFQKLQKINVCLGLLLMLLTLPVLAAIQGKDLSQVPYFWILIFPLFGLVMTAFAYWVLKSYNKTLHDMENQLTDING